MVIYLLDGSSELFSACAFLFVMLFHIHDECTLVSALILGHCHGTPPHMPEEGSRGWTLLHVSLDECLG